MLVFSDPHVCEHAWLTQPEMLSPFSMAVNVQDQKGKVLHVSQAVFWKEHFRK